MKTIYLIDDNPLILEMLKHQLEAALKCQVKCFENRAELKKAMVKWPDLIILDYELNEKKEENGLAILQELTDEIPEVPVILFSGQKSLKKAVELVQAGAIDYVDKNEEAFLEDIIGAAKNVLQYAVARLEIEQTQKSLKSSRSEFKLMALFGSIVAVVLLTIQWLI